MAGRPPEWLRIARDRHASLTDMLLALAESSQRILLNSVNGAYDENGVLLMKDWSDHHLLIGEALGLSRENGSLLDNNHRTAADIEKRILKKHRRKA